jgi:hypothetical protein
MFFAFRQVGKYFPLASRLNIEHTAEVITPFAASGVGRRQRDRKAREKKSPKMKPKTFSPELKKKNTFYINEKSGQQKLGCSQVIFKKYPKCVPNRPNG